MTKLIIINGAPGIGKTTVIERVAGALERRQVVIIDEIGKMELISPAFKAIILEALESDLPTVATIGVSRIAFMEAVRRRQDVQVIRITRDNREGLRDRLLEMIGRTLVDGGQTFDEDPA